MQAAGTGQVTLGTQDGAEIGEVVGRVGVVGAHVGLGDGQGALEQGAGVIEIALVVPNMCEVVEAVRGVGVVRAQAGLADRQGTLPQAAGLRVPRPAVKIVRRAVKQVSGGQRLDLYGDGLLNRNQCMR